MAINTNPSSRRALLAAAAGGTVALVAESLARPLPARAEGPCLILGELNESSSATLLHIDDGGTLTGGAALALRNDNGDTAHAARALWAESRYGPTIEARGEQGYAIAATSDVDIAIVGISTGLIGVVGSGGEWEGTNPATNLTGVRGWSYAGLGVEGQSPKGVGVVGTSDTGTGVVGSSKRTGIHGTTTGSFDIDTNKEVIGVLGTSQSVGGVGGNGIGVAGWSEVGIGVHGSSGGDGIGVEGRSDTGIGVLGAGQQGVHGASGSPGGTGVLAKSETGPALNAVAVYPDQGARAIVAEGPVVFSSAGLGNLVGGKARVTPGVPLDEASKVLITLMRNPGAQALSPYVEVTQGPAGTGFFRVHVPNARAAAVPFAYFVIS